MPCTTDRKNSAARRATPIAAETITLPLSWLTTPDLARLHDLAEELGDAEACERLKVLICRRVAGGGRVCRRD